MSQEDKSELWQELKAAGVQFDRHYREYTTEDLRDAVTELRRMRDEDGGPETGELNVSWQEYQEALGEQVTLPDGYHPGPPPEPVANPERVKAPVPTPEFKPDTDAGVRQNTTGSDEVLGVDEQGFAWYQYEVRKPAFPQPRKRRVLRYIDTGTKIQTVQQGQYIETFEVAGDRHDEAEARITLPSYQVGIYKDPRFPFKVHVYNENRGFDLFEVQDFYGGADLVPIEIKRIYVENVLCYDIRTTIRAIEAEARRLDLMRGTR